MEDFVYAASAAAAAVLFTNPVDVAKTRLQLQGEGTNGKRLYRGPVHCILQTLRVEGVSGAQRGLSTAITREAVLNFFRIGMFEPVLRLYHPQLDDGVPAPLHLKIAAGITTGSTAALVSNPLDLMKTRMQAQASGKNHTVNPSVAFAYSRKMETKPRPVPVWKRKANVEEIVLVRGAIDHRDYTNAMATSVSNKLCRDILLNEHPKNLIDTIKRNNPQPMDTRKSVDDFFEDGRMRPAAIIRKIHTCFPEGAYPNKALRLALKAAMHEEGLNFANTLLVTSRARIDHCRLFQKTDWAFPDETFELGGICGVPFAGRKGLEAALRRVPDGGCLLIEYCSHTGFDYEGELGKVVRWDSRHNQYSPPIRTMREALECYELLVANPDRQRFRESHDPKQKGSAGEQESENNQVGELPGEPDSGLDAARKAAAERVMADVAVDASHDCELDALFKVISENFELISSANIIHHWLATFLQRLTRKLILDVIDTTPFAKNVMCVLVGGIQIETAEDVPDMFSLLTFETRTLKGQIRSHLDQVYYHLKKQEQMGGAGHARHQKK
eukprot:g2569.t1